MRSRGNQREQAVARMLRELGYLVASLRHVGGPADLLALAPDSQPPAYLLNSSYMEAEGFDFEPGRAIPVASKEDVQVIKLPQARPLLVEVKGTTEYPWRSTWGPDRRAEMIEAGVTWGVEPMLAWWPPSLRGGPMWLPVEDWPA